MPRATIHVFYHYATNQFIIYYKLYFTNCIYKKQNSVKEQLMKTTQEWVFESDRVQSAVPESKAPMDISHIYSQKYSSKVFSPWLCLIEVLVQNKLFHYIHTYIGLYRRKLE